ncbi:MAG: hypothetical protein ACE5K7_00210, partial [Phycisphaerae bacterium]
QPRWYSHEQIEKVRRGDVSEYQSNGVWLELAEHFDEALQIEFGFGQQPTFPDRQRATGKFEQHIEDGRLPIISTRYRHGPLVWNQTVFCRLLEAEQVISGREVLLTEVCWSVRNDSDRPQQAKLWAQLGGPHCALGYKVRLAERSSRPLRPLRFEPPYVLDDRGLARLAAMVEDGGQVRLEAHLPGELCSRELSAAGLETDLLSFQIELPAGGSARCRLVIPFFAEYRPILAEALETDFDAAYGSVREYWGRQLAIAGRIRTPERLVDDVFDATLPQALIATGRRARHGHWILKTSPNNYEGLWSGHAAVAAWSLDARGHHQMARRVYETFLRNQGPAPAEMLAVGSHRAGGEGFSDHPGFLGNIEKFMAVLWMFYHGWVMWGIGQHYRFTGDEAWLRRHADRLVLACDWIIQQRQRTMRTDAAGRPVRHWGLLPAGNAFDWGSGNFFWSDAHNWRGFREICEVLAMIGDRRAEQLSAQCEQYRQDIIRAVMGCRDEARPVPLDDGRSIPFVPMDAQRLDYMQPDWTYVACGPLHLAWAGVIGADHELIEQTLAFLEAGRPVGRAEPSGKARAGWTISSHGLAAEADQDFRQAMCPESGRAYFWRHKMTYEPGWPVQSFIFQDRDQTSQFLEHLYSLIGEGGMHVPLRSPVESRDGAPWTQPGAALLMWLIRRMLVDEQGDQLLLGGYIPRAWLGDGQTVGFEDLPTHFGRMSLSIESRLSVGAIVATIWPPTRRPPELIRLRLRHPDGARPRQVLVNGQRHSRLEADQILIEPTRRRIDVYAGY